MSPHTDTHKKQKKCYILFSLPLHVFELGQPYKMLHQMANENQRVEQDNKERRLAANLRAKLH